MARVKSGSCFVETESLNHKSAGTQARDSRGQKGPSFSRSAPSTSWRLGIGPGQPDSTTNAGRHPDREAFIISGKWDHSPNWCVSLVDLWICHPSRNSAVGSLIVLDVLWYSF